jgi:hypothetical protein
MKQSPLIHFLCYNYVLWQDDSKTPTESEILPALSTLSDPWIRDTLATVTWLDDSIPLRLVLEYEHQGEGKRKAYAFLP